MNNQRTFELFLLGGIIALGAPCAVLLGYQHGERTGEAAYPKAAVATTVSVDYRPMVMGTPEDVEHGKTLFQANCMACHGQMADGKGPAAGALKPPPRDFQDASARWTRSREAMDIYRTLSEGSPGTAMVGFSALLTVQDRWALVHYLQTLPGVAGKFKPIDEAMASSWRPEGKP